jgi:hypothetical protein
MDLDSFQPHQPLSASSLVHSSLDYIPPTVRRVIYKTFYIGFFTIFDAIAHVLKTPNGIPTPPAVMQAAMDIHASAVQFYLGKGGRVEYVLDGTVDIAREQSSVGDGTFEETFDCDAGEDGKPLGFKELERCANDLEFAGVRLGVGLRESVGWGPYVDREGMDDDSDLD